MIGFLVTLLIVALVIYLGFWVINQIGLPAPAALIARCILGLILLMWLLQQYSWHAGGYYFR